MNIITTKYNSNFYYVRPDISLNRDSNDYFCPDDITEITVAPFLYIRMDKAGKSVQAKFASRYYSSIGYGLNITAQSLINEKYPESFLMANSLDNSTIVSQLYATDKVNSASILQETIKINGKAAEILYMDRKCAPEKSLSLLEGLFNKKAEVISRLTSFKTGDYIAVEIAEHTPVKIGDTITFGELTFQIR